MRRDDGFHGNRTTMEGRCGPLCQHPGCWHFGEKHVAHMKKHKGYMQYLDYIISNKKRSKIKERLSNGELDKICWP